VNAVTGIELGPGSCVLVRAHVRDGLTSVSLVYGLQPEEARGANVPLAEYLQRVRDQMRFPRRARVVAWGLHESGPFADDETNATVRPVIDAGFRVEEVLTPPEALALMARQRRRHGRNGTAWLALNDHGAAIAIVCGGELVYAREFAWRYRPAPTAREELLQRYTLVAHLAPELRHGLDTIAPLGHVVDGVVTCGNLPDLRSLTMPLIEELDMEVETLDTPDGLDVPPAVVDEVGERAPAMRLAAAAGAGRGLRTAMRTGSTAAAAALFLLVALGWGVMQLRPDRGTASPSSDAAMTPVPQAASPPVVPAPPPDVPSTPSESNAERSAEAASRPEAVAAMPAATTGRSGSAPAATEQRVETGSRVDQRAPSRQAGPLQDPLPVVNSILVAPDRRIAVVDGEIVREGASIGRRVLIRIEPDAVVLREPSGFEVRVPLRRRVSGDAGA
jgi:hypothetical protein